jgi:hypothetical protein
MAAMRSLFTTVKTRRVLFTNPAALLTGHAIQPPPAQTLDNTRQAGPLRSLDKPGERLIVLLAGVHALRLASILPVRANPAGECAPVAAAALLGLRSPLRRETAD